jgi:hypothetical protein
VLLYLWRKGAFSVEALPSWIEFSKILGSMSVIVTGAVCLRGIGRFLNSDYQTFVDTLLSVKSGNVQSRYDLANYDFDFHAWPIDFSWKESTTSGDTSKVMAMRHTSLALNSLQGFAQRALMYAIAHVFGRRAIYPGSTAMVQTLMAPHLLEGRCKLVTQFGGSRAKLQAEDGNEIDSMFINRRGVLDNGNKLVICSEGNAAFYELGCMVTPLEAEYSVLGWNHPGFAGSTVQPIATHPLQ